MKRLLVAEAARIFSSLIVQLFGVRWPVTALVGRDLARPEL